MKAADRARLTAALREHVAKIAADLRAKMRAEGPVRERARQLHADEQVGEDFDVWTDLLSRRAAVLWVLKSVYVRVLEDRGLLKPGRILDPEAQQLFERLAPNLGETAFLRWVYRDLASPNGGLPELFSPQPAEIALPSDDLSRALIEFWRHRDPDAGTVWSFAEERFEGELMGDLYQELDPVVKDRFALCQTPDFVRSFMLDRTLTPAIETFGADEVRLLDPACGSGHFLIDGLKRLVAATSSTHPDWDRRDVVKNCLNRVVGIDLNDYACALARARLVMTAAEMAGMATLAAAARFHPHVYWGDGLEQVEKGKDTRGQQLDLLDPSKNEAPRASLTRPEIRAALREVLGPQFHAVVANPPYIVETDERRKEYHREKTAGRQRYVSAFRLYSLGAPFTERAFQLATKDGFVGLITADSFMKRVFGRPLVEQFLRHVDLTLLVDTSKAEVLQRDSTTVLIFGRNRMPTTSSVHAVMGRRGETEPPTDPARGKVWSSIVANWNSPAFENDFITVADLPRDLLDTHPWSLSGGGAPQLLEHLDKVARCRLADRAADVGRTMHTGLDDAFFVSRSLATRWDAKYLLPLVRGEGVRDWAVEPSEMVIFPYDPESLEAIPETPSNLMLHLWRLKRLLSARVDYGKSMGERGLKWFEWSMFFKDRLRAPRGIAFPIQATHNHFALVKRRAVFNSKAPLILFDAAVPDETLLAVLGTLNSSVIAFWMRQNFQPRGGQSTGKKRQSEEWSRRLELDATKLKRAPLAEPHSKRIGVIAERLTGLAEELEKNRPSEILKGSWTQGRLGQLLGAAKDRLSVLRNEMVAWQEELDWTTYAAFRIPGVEDVPDLDDVEPLASEHRPFAIRLARTLTGSDRGSYWFTSMGVTPAAVLPTSYREATRARLQRRLHLIESVDEISLLEAPEFKRKWEPITFDADVKQACLEWLGSRVEMALKNRGRPSSVSQLVAAIQDDPSVLAIASLYQERRDVDLSRLVTQIIDEGAVPNHPFHTYTESGLTKHAAWQRMWVLQRLRDAGQRVDETPMPPEYSQGSRGKSSDFLRTEYWQLRGKLDVPGERFIAFTEVPAPGETLYGWAGWTPLQRLRALLTLDEELEDAGRSLRERVGALDSAWRLLPDAFREDQAVANRLKAELQAVVGVDGPSHQMLDDWRKRCSPPGGRVSRKAEPEKSEKEFNAR